MVVDKVVRDKDGRRRRRRRRRRRPGIANQKQEPHTKLWGKTCIVLLLNKILVMPNSNA